MSTQPVPDGDSKPGRWMRIKPMLLRWLRRVENVLFGLVLLLIVCYFILQTHAVQNWLIEKITTYLSAELKTKVEIRHVDIEFFDNLALEGFYVQDLQGDTLLYAEKLTAGLNSNIFSLLVNKLEFNEISLTHARFNIRRPEDVPAFNIQFLLDYFASDKPNTGKPKPFSIKVQNLRLTDVSFLKDDKRDGQRMLFNLPSGIFKINNFDPSSKILDVRSAKLEGFSLSVADYPSKDWPEDTIQEPVDTSYSAPFRFRVNNFSLTDGQFRLDKFNTSPARETPDAVMDYKHLNVNKIDIQADSVVFNSELQFTGILRNLSAREQCGFKLEHCEAGRVVVNDTIVALYKSRLRSEKGTSIGDSILLHYRSYPDFNDFERKVRMDIRMAAGSRVRLGDVAYFSQNISENPFFIQNMETIADITGRVEGRVNRLNGRALDIRVGNGTVIQGEFDGNDMNEGSDRLQLLFRFTRLQSDIATISKIIPGFNPPKAIAKLGRIGYKGEYNLLFGTDHILNGYLITDIGSGKLDMLLKLADKAENATYSGRLNMNGFDLGAWTGDPDFGKTTFKISIAEGSKGLTLPSVKAQISGVIDTFNYRGYNYRNVRMNGIFKERVFEGQLGVEDPNIDFRFDGTVDMKDSVTRFVFQSDLRRLDLGALNLLDQDWVISAKIDKIHLKAKDLDDLTGSVMLRNIRILQDRQFVHRIDSIQFISSIDERGNNQFSLHSDIADGTLQGRFLLTNTIGNLVNLIRYYHPSFAQKLGSPKIDSIGFNDRYTMQVHIKDSKGLTRLLSEDLDTLRNVNALVDVDALAGFVHAAVTIPQIHFGSVASRQVNVKINLDRAQGQYEFNLPSTTISEKTQLPPILLNGWLDRDRIGFKLTSQDTAKNAYFVKGLNLAGILSIADSLWQVKFNASKLALFNESWVISEDNYVRFGKGFFATKDFEFFNGNQRILLDSFNRGRGLSLSLTNFNLSFLNKIIDDENFRCRGNLYDFDVRVQDIFQLKGLHSFITSDTVFINDIPYGSITGNLDMESLASPLTWKIFMLSDHQQKLRVAGAWLPSGDEPAYASDVDLTVKPGEFQTQVNANNFPLNILEVFIAGISKTSGGVTGDAKLGGTFSRVGLNGSARIQDGQFQMDYLKALFHIRNQKIDLTDYKIWADGDTIYDGSNKNMAVIRGGIRHDHLRRLTLDCEIESKNDNFMILNTLRDDNGLYYGQGIGYFKAKFTGNFVQTNIQVDAVTGKDSRLYIPLGTPSDVNEVTFITLRDKNPKDTAQDKTNSIDLTEIKGLNFEMNLTITKDSETQLIFDERTGDIIKGRGEGDIKLVINREGEFKMYGNYRIKRGEYLFTLLNFVKKPFTVADGGTITWFGDPYSAQINLDATYEEITPVYNLIRDEIQLTAGDKNSESDAQKATRAIVTMHLKGELMKPTITFDLDFPNATGQLKTLVDNKLRLLRQDQNELDRQVFGLIVVGSFLPSNSNQFLQSTDYLASGLNTVTQVLSNQFSNYLSGLATEWFGGKVSSIDFNIAYNEYQNSIVSEPGTINNQIGRELQVRLSSGLANDRIKIQFGSQFGVGSQNLAQGSVPQDGFLGEDVTVEIQLTENRQWSLKIYQRTEPDVVVGQRRARYGLGVSFRKEFDSFDELISGASGWFKKSRS